VYFDIGQYQSTVEDCDQILIDFFKNDEVYALRAKARERLGDEAGAERDRERIQALLNSSK